MAKVIKTVEINAHNPHLKGAMQDFSFFSFRVAFVA